MRHRSLFHHTGATRSRRVESRRVVVVHSFIRRRGDHVVVVVEGRIGDGDEFEFVEFEFVEFEFVVGVAMGESSSSSSSVECSRRGGSRCRW